MATALRVQTGNSLEVVLHALRATQATTRKFWETHACVKQIMKMMEAAFACLVMAKYRMLANLVAIANKMNIMIMARVTRVVPTR